MQPTVKDMKEERTKEKEQKSEKKKDKGQQQHTEQEVSYLPLGIDKHPVGVTLCWGINLNEYFGSLYSNLAFRFVVLNVHVDELY